MSFLWPLFPPSQSFFFFSDLTRNPLIVPLKVLRGHVREEGKEARIKEREMGAVCLAFHPRQPWLFTGGGDGVINLFQDI